MAETTKRNKLVQLLEVALSTALVTVEEITKAVEAQLPAIFTAIAKKMGLVEFLTEYFAKTKHGSVSVEKYLKAVRILTSTKPNIEDLMKERVEEANLEALTSVLQSLYDKCVLTCQDMVETMPNEALWKTLNAATQRELGFRAEDGRPAGEAAPQRELIEEDLS